MPFLYELKALLDWSVTPTTLTLVDWLKLEDIRASLYNRQCDLVLRAMARRSGAAQPAVPKLLLGFSLFLGLLALLWTPLLAFSTTNPTFRIPHVTNFAFNASLLHVVPVAEGGAAATEIPLFSSSMQHAVLPWLRSNSSATEPKALAAYSPAQLQLLCAGQDSDQAWPVAPGVRRRLHALLQQEEAAGDATETAAVWLDLGFTVMRSFPPVTAYGGPECGGSMHVQLSRGAAGAVAAVLNGSAAWAPLSGWPTGVPQAQTGWLGITMPAEGLLTGVEPSGAPGVGLFPWVWQVKEHHCSVRPSLAAVSTPPRTGPGAPALHRWPLFQVSAAAVHGHTSIACCMCLL